MHRKRYAPPGECAVTARKRPGSGRRKRALVGDKARMCRSVFHLIPGCVRDYPHLSWCFPSGFLGSVSLAPPLHRTMHVAGGHCGGCALGERSLARAKGPRRRLRKLSRPDVFPGGPREGLRPISMFPRKIQNILKFREELLAGCVRPPGGGGCLTPVFLGGCPCPLCPLLKGF